MSGLRNNSQKTPFAQSLQRVAAARAASAVQALGKSLPCTVADVVGPGIVTVNFSVAVTPAPLPQVTMPVGKPPYINYPIQVGDIGVAISADLLTGGLTGLGGGTPNIRNTVGNLSAMTFFWLGSTSESFLDPEALELYGNITCTPDALGFFGQNKVSQQSVAGPAGDIGTVITLANSIRDLILAYGLAD